MSGGKSALTPVRCRAPCGAGPLSPVPYIVLGDTRRLSEGTPRSLNDKTATDTVVALLPTRDSRVHDADDVARVCVCVCVRAREPEAEQATKT